MSVSTAGAPDSLRVHVWRKLRSLGALYLQQSVCLLPAQERPNRDVRRLADRVQREGGTVRVLRMTFADPQEESDVIAELNTARDGEYADVLERIPALRQELAQERARGRLTYVEVEESEADLSRFRSWLTKIRERDYFGAPLGASARAAVEDAAAELAAFEAAALESEAPPSGTSPADVRPQLRMVDPS
ncbi:hypothetical protein GCM10009609_30040 [Pseudonocardia aurantiaca]